MQINQSVQAVNGGLVGVVKGMDSGRVAVTFQVNKGGADNKYSQEQNGGEWEEVVLVFSEDELKAL